MTTVPQLARPGAGLPFFELMISRLAFRLARSSMSREVAARKFRIEAARMIKIAGRLDATFAEKQVLIDRIRGIEDSSRNWSVFMTLAHLVIVDRAIGFIIEQLAANSPISKKVSTAEVKPEPQQSTQVIETFRQTTEEYLERVDRVASLTTPMRHAHPWFGSLDGHGWHCLAAIHHGIHRKQIERIIATASRS